MEKIKEMANALGEEIKETKEYKDYYEIKKKHDNDKGLQDLIGEFNLKKANYLQENEKEQLDDTKLKLLQDEMRDVYSKIMANETMQRFLVVKRDFDKLIEEVYNILNYHITGEEPHSCGSDCSHCSGGCH